jgi:hypothetical protein
LVQIVLGYREAKFVQIKGPDPLQRGDNHKKCKIGMGSFKNLLLQNHWANFNYTWHKSFLGKEKSSLFKKSG